MLSEWLVEVENTSIYLLRILVERLRCSIAHINLVSIVTMQVPEDLETSWLLILCPEGRRNFVIAANGTTKVKLLVLD